MRNKNILWLNTLNFIHLYTDICNIKEEVNAIHKFTQSTLDYNQI